jgi:hypothetical protein
VLTLIAFGAGAASAAGQGNSGKCTAQGGQSLIDEGRYEAAVREFACVIAAHPTEVEGYRGKAEAELLLGRYADAFHSYTRVTAFVEPVHSDAKFTIFNGYDSRLSINPDDITALMGASFARWYYFDYTVAIPILNHLLEVEPLSVYGNLFRGSSRLLHHSATAKGKIDIETALLLAPDSADVHYIVADAYTYGVRDFDRAFLEVTIADALGLETARTHAIFGAVYLAFGDVVTAAAHIQSHIDMVTTELLPADPLAAGGSMSLDFVPGRTYEIPLPVTAGKTVSVSTSSHDYWDTILVVLAPDGTPVTGGDDFKGYFAGFEWVPPASGTYRMRVTFFESVITGSMFIQRGR